jgi:outer membrane murein-binding lipoprotein Lpp
LKERNTTNIKEEVNSDIILELNEQIEQLDSQNDKLVAKVAQLETSEKAAMQELESLRKESGTQEQALKKEIQTLKYENKR